MSGIQVFSSPAASVESRRRSWETFGYMHNLELVTTEQATRPGYQSAIFFAELPPHKLGEMTALIGDALGEGGPMTIHYKIYEDSNNGSSTQSQIITSIDYRGRTVKSYD